MTGPPALPPAYVPHYRQVLAGLGLTSLDPAAPQATVDPAFLAFLLQEFARQQPFDAGFYAQAYPDVGGLIAAGLFSDFQDHFIRAGYQEGRLPHRLAFERDAYADRHPDLAPLRGHDDGVALTAHFLQHGRFEGRSAHPDADAAAARWALAAARRSLGLAHRSLTDAVVHAFLTPLLGPAGRGFRGGPVLTDAPEDAPLRHCRGGRPIDSFPPRDPPRERLAGAFVFAGAYCDHFGHAMAEMIHRILPARALFECRRLLFVGPATGWPPGPFAALPPVMQAALNVLQVDPRSVTVIHDSRVVERLHIVQQGSDLSLGPRPGYLGLLTAVTPALLAAAAPDGQPAADRLYVSRSRIIHGGLLLGERYLEDQLQREGWTVLHPQDLPLAGQMQAYRRARQVLFAEGSACHGVELLGSLGLAHCVLLPRRAESLHVFQATLRPRARRFDVLPRATLLGSVVADGQTGAALDNLGVSLLDFAALAPALRGLGLADLPGLNIAAYARAARADLAAHIAHHKRAGTPMVAPAAIKALQDRLAAALRPRA
jgi:hypothetical protein